MYLASRKSRQSVPAVASKAYKRHGRVSVLPRRAVRALRGSTPPPLPCVEDGAGSPRGRSKSPRGRSKSPKRGRSKSPKRGRSKSPKHRSKSPKGRSKSPRGRSKSPRAKSRDREAKQNVLKVTEVDLEIPKNCEAHHTSQYELCDPEGELDEETGLPRPQKLVLRRGQDVQLGVTFDRDYDKDKDDLKLALAFVCPDPRVANGTRTVLRLDDQKEVTDEEKPRILSINGKTVRLAFRFPPRAIVGAWTINLEVKFKAKKHKAKKFWRKLADTYVIFNPWCKDDPVFLDDEKLLEEYILNDTGAIYFGSSKNVRARPWNFGQFEYNVLPGVMSLLLEKADLSIPKRANPVEVTRMMAAMVNSNDEDGVLIGAWPGKEGDFGYGWPDGTSPMSWKGSIRILEEYFRTKEPVKYAQCWVFSGVLTTVLRTLGIPARSVTNFDSAHDGDASCTIDKYYDKDNKYQGGDSIWNYHVWNEAWMVRDDLRDGYGGWQAVDATPQEPSGGLWTCGPCPVDGIKQGNNLQLYDAAFVFAEVNADIVTWKQDDDGEWEVLSVKSSHVGKMISTKEPHGTKRLDLTGEYKYPDGSDEEKAAVMRAVRRSTTFDKFSKIYDATGCKDVEVDVVDTDKLLVGQEAVIKVTAKNTGKEKREVSLGITISSMYYTGVIHDEIKTHTCDVLLSPGQTDTVVLTVPVKEYWPKVVDMCYFKVYCVGHEKDTKQSFLHEDKFILNKPDINIKAPSSVTGGEDMQVELKFTNPLHIPLTKCSFTLEGALIVQAVSTTCRAIGAGQEGRVMMTVSVKKAGKKKRELIASFHSRELCDLAGSAVIQVN